MSFKQANIYTRVSAWWQNGKEDDWTVSIRNNVDSREACEKNTSNSREESPSVSVLLGILFSLWNHRFLGTLHWNTCFHSRKKSVSCKILPHVIPCMLQTYWAWSYLTTKFFSKQQLFLPNSLRLAWPKQIPCMLERKGFFPLKPIHVSVFMVESRICMESKKQGKGSKSFSSTQQVYVRSHSVWIRQQYVMVLWKFLMRVCNSRFINSFWAESYFVKDMHNSHLKLQKASWMANWWKTRTLVIFPEKNFSQTYIQDKIFSAG